MQMITDTQRHTGRFKCLWEQIAVFHCIMRLSYSKRPKNHIVSTTCIYFDTWVIRFIQEVLHEKYTGWSETPETSRSQGSKYAEGEISRPFQTLKHMF